MATERQIEANRLNAARSTGPVTAEGKSRSRANATKHGMAAESADLEARQSPEFAERRSKWAAEQPPVGEAGNWALDRAVAASLRIERCEESIDELVEAARRRAELAWDEDRAIEAATIAGRLSRDPVLASRQLKATSAGVLVLFEAWVGLFGALEGGEDWSDAQASKALDLLGVDPDLRSGRTAIDAPEGADPVSFRRELALEQLDRLEALRDEAMAPLDEMERRRAARGNAALLSKEAKLMLRYERDAWRRYREAMKEVKPQVPAPTSAPAPAPTPFGFPLLRGRAAEILAHPYDEPRRTFPPAPTTTPPAAPAQVEPTRHDEMASRLADLEQSPVHFLGIDILEGQVEALTERTQFAGIPLVAAS